MKFCPGAEFLLGEKLLPRARTFCPGAKVSSKFLPRGRNFLPRDSFCTFGNVREHPTCTEDFCPEILPRLFCPGQKRECTTQSFAKDAFNLLADLSGDLSKVPCFTPVINMDKANSQNNQVHLWDINYLKADSSCI